MKHPSLQLLTVVFLTIALTALTASGLTPMRRVTLSQQNVRTELSKPNNYIIIEDDINLSGLGTITLTPTTVLDFRGGRFHGGTLVINSASVRAPMTCIFDGTTTSGTFGNAEVPAHWFGTPGEDVGPMVNRALQMATKNIVTLGGGDYKLGTTIVMGNQFQRFTHSGTLTVTKNITAFDMQTTNQKLTLHKLVYSSTSDSKSSKSGKKYTGTGIALTGNTYHCDIKADIITGFERGIAIVPDPKNQKFAGTQYCNFDFMQIEADKCFYVDLIEYMQRHTDATDKTTWFTESRVNGGLMSGNYGIFFNDSVSKKHENQALIFNNISFDHIKKKPIRLRRLNLCYFNGLHFGSDIPANEDLIEMDHCTNMRMTVLSNLPYERVYAGPGNFNVYIDGVITDNGINEFMGIDRMAIFCNHIWADLATVKNGKSTKYLTSTLTPLNMEKSIEYIDNSSGSSGQLKTTTITLDDLRAPILKNQETKDDIIINPDTPFRPLLPPYENVVLNSICNLKIQKMKVTLDMDLIYDYTYTSLIIRLTLEDSGQLFFKSFLYPSGKSITESGTYMITRNVNRYPDIVRLD